MTRAGTYKLSLNRAARPAPELASLLIERGRELARRGNLDEALARFEEALVLDPIRDIEQVKQEASEFATSALIEQARDQLGHDQTANAVAKLEQAQSIAQEINSGVLHLAICRLQRVKELAEVGGPLRAQTWSLKRRRLSQVRQLPAPFAAHSALPGNWQSRPAALSRLHYRRPTTATWTPI